MEEEEHLTRHTPNSSVTTKRRSETCGCAREVYREWVGCGGDERSRREGERARNLKMRVRAGVQEILYFTFNPRY